MVVGVSPAVAAEVFDVAEAVDVVGQLGFGLAAVVAPGHDASVSSKRHTFRAYPTVTVEGVSLASATSNE